MRPRLGQGVMAGIEEIFQNAKKVEIHEQRVLAEKIFGMDKHLLKRQKLLLQLAEQFLLLRAPLVNTASSKFALLMADERNLVGLGDKFLEIDVVQLEADGLNFVFDRDVRADVVFPGSVEQLAGTAEATWKRGPRVLARMAGRILPAAEGEAPLRLAVSGDLLPASPGRRHVEGTLAAAGWAGLAAGTAEGLRAELRTPDVAAQLAQLRSLWPRLVPALPPEIPVRGGLTADLRLDGPLADPRAKVQAEWTPEAAARVVVQAEGRWSTRAGRAEATVTNLPLAALGPAVPATGTLNAHLALDGSPRGYDTLLTADATGLFVAANASDTVRLDRVQIASGGRLGLEPLAWTGTAVVDGTGLDASGRAQAAEVHLQVEEAALSAAVASGRIRLDVPRLDLPQDGRAIDGLHLEAAGDRREVRISTLTGSFEEGRTFAASGRALLEPLLAEADLELDLVRPVEAVRAAGLSASLRGGILGVSVPHLETEAGPAHQPADLLNDLRPGRGGGPEPRRAAGGAGRAEGARHRPGGDRGRLDREVLRPEAPRAVLEAPPRDRAAPRRSPASTPSPPAPPRWPWSLPRRQAWPSSPSAG